MISVEPMALMLARDATEVAQLLHHLTTLSLNHAAQYDALRTASGALAKLDTISDTQKALSAQVEALRAQVLRNAGPGVVYRAEVTDD